jgi:hypothetical protein
MLQPFDECRRPERSPAADVDASEKDRECHELEAV